MIKTPSENRKKETAKRSKRKSVFDPARPDRRERKTAQGDKAKEALGAKTARRSRSYPALLGDYGWTSLDGESRQFLSWMLRLDWEESNFVELEQMFPLLPLRSVFSLWREHGFLNLEELRQSLSGTPKEHLLSEIRWTDLTESYEKITGDRFRGVNHAQELMTLFRSEGRMIKDQVWDTLTDGSGICLQTREVKSSKEMDALRALAILHKEKGSGFKLLAVGVGP